MTAGQQRLFFFFFLWHRGDVTTHGSAPPRFSRMYELAVEGASPGLSIGGATGTRKQRGVAQRSTSERWNDHHRKMSIIPRVGPHKYSHVPSLYKNPTLCNGTRAARRAKSALVAQQPACAHMLRQ